MITLDSQDAGLVIIRNKWRLCSVAVVCKFYPHVQHEVITDFVMENLKYHFKCLQLTTDFIKHICCFEG